MQHGFLKVAAATPRIRVADCGFNVEQIIIQMQDAAQKGVRLLVFPELCITGYTCSDLFFQPTLQQGALEGLEKILTAGKDMDMVCVVGLPLALDHKLYNCAAVICRGEILGIVPKTNIPNHNEYYEFRNFAPAPEQNRNISLLGRECFFGTRLLFGCRQMPLLQLAVEICEDLWVPCPPSVSHALAGATVIANPSASNVLIGKGEYRRELVKGQSGRLICGYIYSNAGEGESTTDVVYDGHSMIGENGVLLAERNSYETGLLVTELDLMRLDGERRKMTSYPQIRREGYETIWFELTRSETVLTRPVAKYPFIPMDTDNRASRCREILAIQCNGLKKRLEHSHSKTAVVGISGGLDSCLALLVAAGAMDLLSRSHRDVIAVTMPCFGTTHRTKSNAERLTEKLGATLRVIDIAQAVKVHFHDIGHAPDQYDVVFENSQARERTQVLMDVANQTGGLVVGTGDLSELALGWATYNGDHMSMYGVNASVPKTLIRHIVRYAADSASDPELAEVLRDILDTPVSPELLPAKDGEISQKTEDLVGPYALHDFFLYYAVRWGFEPEKVYRLARYAFGEEYSPETVLYWEKNFYRRFFAQQFKRSCLPDGPKVGSVSLSPRGDWRMPSDACADLWLAKLERIQPK